MLEQLFGSRTRVKLLRLFLGSPNEHFFVREITRVVGEQINSVRRELQNLEDMELVVSSIEEKKKYYSVNPDFPLLQELQALILKTRLITEREFIGSIRALGPMDFFALYGQFMGDATAPTDILIIGTVSKTRLEKLIQQFSETFGKQIRYTVLTKEEYEYRRDVADTFLSGMLNRPSVIMKNEMNIVAPGAMPAEQNPFYKSVHSPSQTRWTKRDDAAAAELQDEIELAGSEEEDENTEQKTA